MIKLTYKPVKIEIIYSNSDTRKIGINEGDIFEAKQEYYNDNPKSCFYFNANGIDCVAYDVQHDENSTLLVTTCKIAEQTKEEKQIKSNINRIKAQIKQLNESDLFSKQDRERLNPIYEQQLLELNLKSNPLGYNSTTKKFNFSDVGISFNEVSKTIIKAFQKNINEMEVIEPEFLSNQEAE